MKKITTLLIISALFLVSCGDKKKEEVKKEVVSVDAIAQGKKLFSSKGCMACHNETSKIIGPAVKDIASIYADKKGNLVSFLKGTATAIVDTDEGQVAIMKATLQATKLSGDELSAISAYIRSVK